MKLYIVSGLPGSGKTYWANQKRIETEMNGEYCACYSADDYFEEYDPQGNLVYNFNPKEIQDAHTDCFSGIMGAMFHNADVCIVHNTFTQNWEISPYIAIANKYGYEHQIIRFICDAKHSLENNTHNVPEKTIKSMYARMEKPLPFWNYEAKVVDWK